MHTISIEAFKDPDNVSNLCRETNEPILVKNPDGENLVIMSIETFHRYIRAAQEEAVRESAQSDEPAHGNAIG